MNRKWIMQRCAAARGPLLAAALGLCLFCSMAILAGATVADGDGGNSGHGGGNSGPGGGDGDDNSGSGDNSGPGSGDDDGGDDDGGEGEEGGHGAGASHNGAGDPGADPYVRGEIVVANVSQVGLKTIRSYGFRILEETRLEALDLTVLRLAVPPGWQEERARQQIAAAVPGVIVDLNSLYAMQGQAALPQPGYGPAMIGWNRRGPGCGRGMRIGMIDTAVDGSLPAFDGALMTQGALAPTATPAPHGTAVAAVLVAQPGGSAVPGLLPEAELQVAGVFAPDSAGRLSADAVAMVGGLNWLAQRRAGVVNMSLAGDSNELVKLAIERMSARGTLFVAAVGNDGPNAPPGFPATMPEVIGVTAVDSAGQPYKNAPAGSEIDFAAPGVRIWSPDKDNLAGRYFSGTSFAAPFVTAAVALAVQEGAHDREAVMQRLAANARDFGAAGKDSVFGWGLVKAPAACGIKSGAS